MIYMLSTSRHFISDAEDPIDVFRRLETHAFKSSSLGLLLQGLLYEPQNY